MAKTPVAYIEIESLNPFEKDKLRKAIDEMVNSMNLVDNEKLLQKATLDALKSDLSVDPKIVRKLANIRHKQNKAEVFDEFSRIENSYEQIGFQNE